MKIKAVVLSLVGAVLVSGVMEAATLSSGNYMTTISPSIKASQATKVQDQLASLKALQSATVDPNTSTVHFSVKDGQSITVADLQTAVQNAEPGASLSTPIVETGSSTTGASGAVTTSPNNNKDLRKPNDAKF